MQQQIIEVKLTQITANPYQPRRNFSSGDLKELAESIKNQGLIHPPVVVPLVGERGRYELISGERRFRAAEMAGLKKIHVLVKDKKRSYSAEASLVENIQRVDLNPLEIAKALKRLIAEFSYLQEELADRIGKKRATVANYLRLLSLPNEAKKSLAAGEITMGHAKVLLSLNDCSHQITLLQQVKERGLSVREAEKAAKNFSALKKAPLKTLLTKDCHLAALQEKMEQKLGTKVSIIGKGKKGKICIDYYSLDDLDRILEIFNFSS